MAVNIWKSYVGNTVEETTIVSILAGMNTTELVYIHTYIYICIYIYIYIYIYRESASRFSRGTVLNTLKQSGINILRGKKDATAFSRQACFVK